jgi:hypothetical protein
MKLLQLIGWAKPRETRAPESRQMGTQGVHMKGVPPWLVRWAPRSHLTPLSL